jgi:PAP2 superfamily
VSAAKPTTLDLPPATPRPRLRWWREVVVAVVFYSLYTLVRDLHTTTGGTGEAERNARWVVRAERDLHIFDEQKIQHAVLGWRAFIQFWNSYYGTVHFVAVVGVLIFLFRREPQRYPLMRNTFALMGVIALLGFSFFPLLPPRLLPPSYGFVDTLQVYGGVWNFSSGAVAEASNQYAAMPSLHTGWSTWCAVSVMPSVRPWWGKVALLIYPAATVYCIVITANHYFLDAVGGLVTLGLSYLLARPLTRWWAQRTWLRPTVRADNAPSLDG